MTEATDETTNLSETTNIQFYVGDKIRVEKVDKENNQLDPEDYYYLKTFENKIGTICEKYRNGKGIYAYRVEFSGDNFGYFYERDISLVEHGEANNG